ncbi:hypothetical protein Salat_1530000 [Sesamum alatum]|uniref:TRF2/HOY1 PH-like domain-containing protein n=1 Tax=Sesamum alatum TaxID=300844 RepID=A0AAE2CMG4_9LAMI|nr:hypothetical protein Salat_1530000 [Sesamum alatum]
MSESDESVFWSEKEAGSFGSEDFQSNQSYGSKRIRFSPEFDDQLQEGDADSSAQSSPLGLTLRKTPSFLNLVQRCLSRPNQPDLSSQNDHVPGHNHKPRRKADDSGSQPMSEKLKASNFPAIFIKIGTWQRITRHEGDLVAKLYYAKRKLVWEVLDGALKSKIEIQWSDIIAIRAVTHENEPGTLEIELNQPPLFYRETNPQPRKHTLWQQASDFTGGQAPIWRRHYVRFPPGILDKHYEKLLQCDQRLFALSREPFPSQESPYFDPTMFAISELSLSFNGYGSRYHLGSQYHYQTYPTTARGAPARLTPNSTTSVTDLPYRNEGGTNNQNYQGRLHITSTTLGNQVLRPYNHHQSNVGVLNDIENHLLGESQVVTSDEGALLHANVETMCSLLESTGENPIYNAGRGSVADPMMENGRRNINLMVDGVNWLPPQGSSESMHTVDNSIPSFMFPCNTNNGEFFNI